MARKAGLGKNAPGQGKRAGTPKQPGRGTKGDKDTKSNQSVTRPGRPAAIQGGGEQHARRPNNPVERATRIAGAMHRGDVKEARRRGRQEEGGVQGALDRGARQNKGTKGGGRGLPLGAISKANGRPSTALDDHGPDLKVRTPSQRRKVDKQARTIAKKKAKRRGQ